MLTTGDSRKRGDGLKGATPTTERARGTGRRRGGGRRGGGGQEPFRVAPGGQHVAPNALDRLVRDPAAGDDTHQRLSWRVQAHSLCSRKQVKKDLGPCLELMRVTRSHFTGKDPDQSRSSSELTGTTAGPEPSVSPERIQETRQQLAQAAPVTSQEPLLTWFLATKQHYYL